MKTLFVLKRIISGAVLAIGLFFVGCKPTPEQIAERTKLLFESIESNDVESAKTYIKAGANVNAKQGEKGITPLLFAIQNDRVEMVDLLIKSKADVNAKDTADNGNTPLILAVYKRAKSDSEKNADIILSLLQAKADVNARNDEGKTVFTYAEEQNKEHSNEGLMKLLKLYAENSKPTAEQAIDLISPMYQAMRRNDIGQVKFCIAAGADVNSDYWDGFPLLVHAIHYAISPIYPIYTDGRTYTDIVELLINTGADVNKKSSSESGRTPFLMCYGDFTMTELLLRHGANANAKDNYGNTALMFAAQDREEETVKLLINAKADVNAKNAEGKTALNIAVEYGNQNIAEQLKAAGAKE